MTVSMAQTENLLVVDRGDAPFIGVSGRQMASLDRGEEMTLLGERGPYTIVCWKGRNGYVPTEHLVSFAEFSDQDPAAEDTSAVEVSERSSRNPLRFLFPWTQRAA
jgi:hypothetical protein